MFTTLDWLLEAGILTKIKDFNYTVDFFDLSKFDSFEET